MLTPLSVAQATSLIVEWQHHGKQSEELSKDLWQGRVVTAVEQSSGSLSYLNHGGILLWQPGKIA